MERKVQEWLVAVAHQGANNSVNEFYDNLDLFKKNYDSQLSDIEALISDIDSLWESDAKPTSKLKNAVDDLKTFDNIKYPEIPIGDYSLVMVDTIGG